MKQIIFKLSLTNHNTPFEITINNFLFEYGIGKEKCGSKDLTLQYALKIQGLKEMNIIKNYIENIAPYLTNDNNIKEIQIKIINDEDNNENIDIVIKQNEFENFNMTYVIDNNPRVMITFSI